MCRYSIFKGKEYSFTLTGEYDLSTRIVKLEKTHLYDVKKVRTFFVDLWWDAAQKKRMMVSAHTMLELTQVEIQPILIVHESYLDTER